MERGTGQTTNQMKNASPGAIYVVYGNRGYYRNLARFLGRDDLVIESPEGVSTGKLHGAEREVVLDHGILGCLALGSRFWDTLAQHRSRLNRDP